MTDYDKNDQRLGMIKNLLSMLKASGKKYDTEKIEKAVSSATAESPILFIP